ncbi:MAG TPA: hypothetical protein VII92_03300 [Anaerolineae bacterium]
MSDQPVGMAGCAGKVTKARIDIEGLLGEPVQFERCQTVAGRSMSIQSIWIGEEGCAISAFESHRARRFFFFRLIFNSAISDSILRSSSSEIGGSFFIFSNAPFMICTARAR